MDFRQTTQSTNVRPADADQPASSREAKSGKKFGRELKGPKWLQVLYGVALVGIAVLLVGIVLALSRGNGGNEFKYVDGSKYQAVFLSNGQVYFGHIQSLNDKYVRVTDVYYLTQSAANSSNNSANSYTLLQLGCQQIHYPTNQMLINHDQVTFWENLNDKGQVVTKINELKKQGVDCSQVSNQTQASSTSSQGSNNAAQSTQNSTGTGK